MRLRQQVALVPVVSTRWDPSRRMTAEQAAQHEWVKENTHRTRMSRAHPRRQSILRSTEINDKTGGDPYMTTSQALIKGQFCCLKGMCGSFHWLTDTQFCIIISVLLNASQRS